ncbi:MAG: ECF-type sigma factor [Gemmatimonadota bacterium]
MSNPTFATLLSRADAGDPAAAGQLFESLYGELHRLAEYQLRRNGGRLTLSATTLLHETYLAMAGRDAAAFPDRGRFLAYAAKAMRSLIVDYARARRALKRGGEFEITQIGDRDAPAPGANDQLERIVDGLERLGAVDPKLSELVDLHFFCGFSLVEIAELRAVSDRTVQRDWRKARLLLEGLLDD